MSRRKGGRSWQQQNIPDREKPLADRTENPYRTGCPIFGRPLIEWIAIALLVGLFCIGPWWFAVVTNRNEVYDTEVAEAGRRLVRDWCKVMMAHNWTRCNEQRNEKACLKRVREFLERHLGPGPFAILEDKDYSLVSGGEQLVMEHGVQQGYNEEYDAEDLHRDSQALLKLMLHWEHHRNSMKGYAETCSANAEVLSTFEDHNGPFNEFLGEASISWPDPETKRIATALWVFDMKGKLREVPRDPRTKTQHEFRVYEFSMTYTHELVWPEHREADEE